VPGSSTSQPQAIQQDRDTIVRLGGWLFRKRTSLPLPIVVALLVIPATAQNLKGYVAAGAATVLLGELIRMWGVRHIGAVSRTRSERLGPLVAGGPFALVRNPLYVGNMLLWLGFTLAAGLPWLAPAVFALLAFEYHAIVRWEEQLLLSRMGRTYGDYMELVPRWIPRLTSVKRSNQPAQYLWGQTLFSERGTLIAIAAGFALLWLKAYAG
jgi:protein-S-isoprenylcysteine O-methyltransferase Ste14